MSHISLRLDGADTNMRKRIKVFCISNPRERDEYEDLINDENINILDETNPVVDKVGRMLVTLKWEEPQKQK